ncbi:1, partial [Durusdinium trenchii]
VLTFTDSLNGLFVKLPGPTAFEVYWEVQAGAKVRLPFALETYRVYFPGTYVLDCLGNLKCAPALGKVCDAADEGDGVPGCSDTDAADALNCTSALSRPRYVRAKSQNFLAPSEMPQEPQIEAASHNLPDSWVDVSSPKRQRYGQDGLQQKNAPPKEGEVSCEAYDQEAVLEEELVDEPAADEQEQVSGQMQDEDAVDEAASFPRHQAPEAPTTLMEEPPTLNSRPKQGSQALLPEIGVHTDGHHWLRGRKGSMSLLPDLPKANERKCQTCEKVQARGRSAPASRKQPTEIKARLRQQDARSQDARSQAKVTQAEEPAPQLMQAGNRKGSMSLLPEPEAPKLPQQGVQAPKLPQQAQVSLASARARHVAEPKFIRTARSRSSSRSLPRRREVAECQEEVSLQEAASIALHQASQEPPMLNSRPKQGSQSLLPDLGAEISYDQEAVSEETMDTELQPEVQEEHLEEPVEEQALASFFQLAVFKMVEQI